MENVHTTSYTYLTVKGSSDIQKNWLLNRDMFIYSKTSISTNNSGIIWDNWCCSCFTCCYRCGHHSLWALARFILSLNRLLFCWFWFKSQIHRRLHNILSWKGILWIFLWNNRSTWISVWGLLSPCCNHGDVFGQPWARNFPLGTGQHHTSYRREPWHSLSHCY